MRINHQDQSYFAPLGTSAATACPSTHPTSIQGRDSSYRKGDEEGRGTQNERGLHSKTRRKKAPERRTKNAHTLNRILE
ncbi:hypothetical protein FSARC_1645 [Fusarium sarcochroum]|uniref:Uncharacterized protein n=1 Tax=Fusarium sarcochroum TaxID=1208366 RepID=A0A8H4U8N4_9HYPO|nr:hypothetical protein FSARC_1645 [Fusarium sarcochroum]